MRDLMGHASIVTTERYDTQRQEILDQAARKLETGVIIKFPSRSERIEAAKARAARAAAARKPRVINQKEVVSRIFAGWNQLDGWLRQVDRMRRVA